MTIEQWLRESVAQPPLSPIRRFIARHFVGLLFWTIILLVFANPIYEFILTWQRTSPAGRGLFLEEAFTIAPLVLGVYTLLYFVLPGKRTGKTGWQQHRLAKQERELRKVVNAIAQTQSPPVFSSDAFAMAAAQLKSFRPMNLDTLQAYAHEPWLRILVLARAIEPVNDKVIKIVSLKSIEEDREAEFDEE
jgi:hypothetical protein